MEEAKGEDSSFFNFSSFNKIVNEQKELHEDFNSKKQLYEENKQKINNFFEDQKLSLHAEDTVYFSLNTLSGDY